MNSERKLYVSQHGTQYWLTDEEAKERNKIAVIVFLVMVLSIIVIAFWR